MAICPPVVSFLTFLVGVSWPGHPGPDRQMARVGADRTHEETTNVFLDCGICDFDYVRRRIRFVRWVRDRQDADIHALVTDRPTGAGGTEYIVNLIGRGPFEGEESTSSLRTDPTNTYHEVRERLSHTIELALVGFTAGTPTGEEIRVVYTPGDTETADAGAEESDPWDSWVFSVGLDGAVSGEETTKSYAITGSVTASRTTEALKFRFSASAGYNEDHFELTEGQDFTSVLRNFQGRGLLAWSLGEHWSAGVRYSGLTSTFANTDLSLSFAPAIEYNLFPYSESSRRELRLLYSVGANRFDYAEETVFGVSEETLYEQTATLALDLVQPWGSAQVALEGSAYLNDMSQNRIGLEINSDWRILKGLSMTLFGGASHIANQRSLSASGLTNEEIILRRRERATTFRYFLSAGLTYTFGSAFASVVNPRLGI